MKFRRNYTIRTTVTAVGNRPLIPPVVTYSGRYWVRWFFAKGVVHMMPQYMPSLYRSVSEVVPITDEIDKVLG